MLEKKGGNTFLSATKAIIDHLTEWFRGTDKIVSMGVVVNKDMYGLEKGICFSLPCICGGKGEFKVIDNIELNEYQKMRIRQGCEELIKEREIVKHYLN